MKLKIIFAILMILFLIGCKEDAEEAGSNIQGSTVVDIDDDSEDVQEEVAEETDDISEEDREKSAEDLIKELWGEEIGTEAEEEAASESKEIIIENFKASPNELSVITGSVIKWTSLMENLKLPIAIYPTDEDGNKMTRTVNDVKEAAITTEISYEYEFNEAGVYKWYSLYKPDRVYGTITVTS